ncbi:MAG TPA: hypothetical protein PLJ21_03100 [Pseudobdellovibrionaceae bacterium]|nr:hypothetical protein [Pseudobdellovibrionaceae bacterium]
MNVVFRIITFIIFAFSMNAKAIAMGLQENKDTFQYGVYLFNPTWTWVQTEEQENVFKRNQIFSISILKQNKEFALEYSSEAFQSGNSVVNLNNTRETYNIAYHHFVNEGIYIGPIVGIIDSKTHMKTLGVDSVDVFPLEILLGLSNGYGKSWPVLWRDHEIYLNLYFEFKILWAKSLTPNPTGLATLRFGFGF